MVDKVVSNVPVDGGSGLNIIPEHTMKKLVIVLRVHHRLSSIWQTKVWPCPWK